ncbi:DEAD/DEAH box helicase [Pseudomonas sp. PDM11]|uniref:DEAD/DEAH box helicase n=1 Tax=Pseudomonas sp. PDM11 TaxID=2769309 RepID=UPI0017846F23|nr:DEAD/DEAH box helicase [Pseudomonas sp. PDM11]MBD9398499.1 DEAD/DEAH box helicase [Pseudomonas sp. PDM11]
MPASPVHFDALPYNLQALLFALLPYVPGQTKTTLIKHMRAMGMRASSSRLVDSSNFDELADELIATGWLTREEHGRQTLLCMAPSMRNQVLLRLLDSADRFALLKSHTEQLTRIEPWLTASNGRLMQEVWLAIMADEGEYLEHALEQLAPFMPVAEALQLHPINQMLDDAHGRSLFERLSLPVRQRLLDDHLLLSGLLCTQADESYRLALQSLEQHDDPSLSLQVLLHALWRGDRQTLEQLEQDEQDLMHVAVSLFAKGALADLLVLLREWIADLRKRTKRRKIELPPVLNALYCLALIKENDASHYSALKQALQQGSKDGYGQAYDLLLSLLDRLQGSRPTPLKSLPPLPQGLDGLLLALALYWLDEPLAKQKAWHNKLQERVQQLRGVGYNWLADEYLALIDRQFGETAAHLESRKVAPLVDLHKRQESWQLALNALSQIRATGAATGKLSHGSRLAWLITMDRYDGLQLEPREQKLNAKGQWSKGRPVALKRLAEELDSLDFLCDQDRQASRLIQVEQPYYGGRQYHLPPAMALQRLVGHPALFWSDAPDVWVDLSLGEPGLYLRTKNGQINLKLQPEGIGHGELYLEKETPTRLKIYPVTKELRHIAEILHNGLSVPQSAKAQLVEAIGSIAPLLPIHSDIPELAAHVEEVPADARLYAHLLPLAEGLRLQLLVRPLAEGGWFRPSQGSERLIGERDGRTVQVARNLKGEQQALQHVLDACPSLASAESDGQEWQLQHPQDALQVLSELQAIDSAQLECVWPEGERMRIKGRGEFQQLKLGLKQQGDWFQLQGSLTLDEGKVIQLRQLLELLKASPGRFIKLGDNDWLAIGNSLRKRLDELAHLAERVNDDGLRLSPLTTPLLAELAEEAGEFKAGKEWQTHLQRLQSLRDYQPSVPSTLQAQLRDYQVDGFNWLARLAHWGVGACLADDMGLGKTVQTLALLLLRAGQGPQLVVAPTSVALNWLTEARRFAPTLQLRNYSQQRNLEGLGPRDLVIVSYGLLQQDADTFAAVNWTSVVIDEAQAIKNAQTKRSQAAMALQADFRLVATGTPLENHLGELWNLMRFINPGLLGSQESFAQRFANPIENCNAGARRALKQLIQPFVLRRLKSQVLDELPPRTEISYSVPLSDDEMHQYEALRQQAVEKLNTADGEERQALQMLAEITRLRRFCCHPSLVMPGSPLASSKLKAFQAIVSELLENRHKALVFSQFVDHLAIVRRWLDEQGIAYQYLDGSTPAKARQAAMEAFQEGDGDIFLISLKAGGSGLNLTAADYVIHLDPWWNPAVEDQASDRAHRMGQQRPVTIYRLVTENTIEQQIVALHARKRDLADSLLDGGEVSGKLDADALLALLRGEA